MHKLISQIAATSVSLIITIGYSDNS